MNPLQKELAAAGYCVSPNNIWGLEGVIMYPSCPGIPEIRLADIQVTDKLIRVHKIANGKRYISGEYADVSAFLANCGDVSGGGQPAGYLNMWD